MPVLIALLSLLIYPSITLALVLGLATYAYIRYGGSRDLEVHVLNIEHHLAFRILCVKLARFDGGHDEDSIRIHANMVKDAYENFYFRRELRNAADVSPEDWKVPARTLAKYGRVSGDFLRSRYRSILMQLSTLPTSRRGNQIFQFTEPMEERLIELARMWKLGPNTVREICEKDGIKVGPVMLAWK